MNNILITGCGDIGKRVACYIHSDADNKSMLISGVIRREEAGAELQVLNINPVVSDLDRPETLQDIPTKGATVFHFAPPPSLGQQDTRFRNLLACFDANGLPEKIVLLSTTAVYGDCNGEWIDESAEVNPQTDRGRRRLDAERALQLWAEAHNVSYVILRVSGIYGPGRLPVERLSKGLPILREDLAPFSNRIHQDDLAMVCVAAAKHAPEGAVYNVCDGNPSTMSHYFKAIAKALDLPMPPELDREQAEKQLSAGMLSYLNESRRLSNRKMREELRITLKYPDLESGLKNISKDSY